MATAMAEDENRHGRGREPPWLRTSSPLQEGERGHPASVLPGPRTRFLDQAQVEQGPTDQADISQ